MCVSVPRSLVVPDSLNSLKVCYYPGMIVTVHGVKFGGV